MKRIDFRQRVFVAFALVAVATVGAVFAVAALRGKTVHAAVGLAPQPIQYPGFPVPAATIEHWIATNDTAAMRQHAWDLWKGINAITPETNGLPVWETWYSGPEIGNQSAGTCAPSSLPALLGGPQRSVGQPVHDFQVPEQFHHGRFARQRVGLAFAGAAAGAPVSVPLEVTVKFDASYAQFVLDNQYCDSKTLWDLQESWGTQPLVNRHIKPFPNTAIGLKPTYEFVNGPDHDNGITLVNYWSGDLTTGPKNSTNPVFPTPDTWTQCVVVNTGSSQPPPDLQCAITNAPGPVSPSGVVGIDQFYHFQLSEADAQNVCAQLGSSGPCPVQAGDYAILVGMHMSTKEDTDWTWQTFWWNYGSTFPYGPPPADIPAPFNHYAMAEGYSMTVEDKPNGPNTLAYNPYLETGLGPTVYGTNSTCMSCHMVASLGNNPNSNAPAPPQDSPNSGSGYPAFYAGKIYAPWVQNYYYRVTNPVAQIAFYDCMTTTDTSWFVQGFAVNPPPNQPPCVLTTGARKSARR